MDFSIIIGAISIIASVVSVILSITNFISTKKDMQLKIKLANSDTKINKTKITNIDELINASLTEVCVSIASYFKKISPKNEIRVYIYKIIDDKHIKIIKSPSELNDNKEYYLNENSVFYQIKKTNDPLLLNNVPYFSKQFRIKRKNQRFDSYSDWNKYYQTYMCYPIKDKNDIIVGFLSVETMNPLNDLIDTKNITDYLEQQCKIISTNAEFLEI